MKFGKWQPLFTVILVVIEIFLSIFFEQKAESIPGAIEQDLPKLMIELKDVSLEEINSGEKNIKFPGNSVTFVVDGDTFEFDNVEIKGRGNTTWMNPKKPYQIKLESKENLFGLGKAKKWVLIANYFDDSFLRNDVGLFFARMLGEDYVTDGQFLELFVDGEYIGLYYLTHKVEVSNGSVNLKDPFGILLELDNIHEAPQNCNYTADHNCLVLKDAVSEDDKDITSQAISNFVEDFNRIEKAAKNKDWETLTEVADMKSFAEYYLISEFTANPDAYTTSCYFYKNGVDDKIHAGPAWDFDFSFSNYRWGEMSPTETEHRKKDLNNPNETYQIFEVFFDLMEIPEFQKEVKAIFRAKVNGKDEEISNRIDESVKIIKDAAKKDGEKWERDNFEDSVTRLKDWVVQRLNFSEEIYGR